MRIILDTQTALWFVYSTSKIPSNIAEIITSDNNEIYVSIASIWEVEIKNRKKPNEMPTTGDELLQSLISSNINIISIIPEHIFEIRSLKKDDALVHNDPFDQIIMAQAKFENMKLITTDLTIIQNSRRRLKNSWQMTELVTRRGFLNLCWATI